MMLSQPEREQVALEGSRALSQKLFRLYRAGAFTTDIQEQLDENLRSADPSEHPAQVEAVITGLLDAGRIVTRLFDAHWYFDQAPPHLLSSNSYPLFDHLMRPDAAHLSPHPLVHAGWYVSFHRLGSEDSILEHIAGQGPHATVNPLFDADYYASVSTPKERFLFVDYHMFGWRDGLDPSPLFATADYLLMYKDIAEWGVDPLFHFLQWGLLERRRPRLQSEVVDIDWYAGPLPSNRHLKYTALSGPFAHLAIITPAPLSEPLRGAIESCVGLDPKLDRAIASSAALPIRALPDCRPRFSFARSLLLDPLATSDLWILSSWLARGGAERVIANIANSFVEQFGPGRVTVVVTDFDRAEVLDWFSHGVNVILLPDLYPRAGPEEICLMLRQAIIFARPQTVLNVNSVTGWRLFEQYGRPLSRLTRFMAAFFCNDYDSNGTPVGYFADYFDDTFEIVSTYITDHATFLGGMFERKNLGPAFDERVHVLYQPVVLPTAKATASSRAKSRTVLWVGRYSAQKRPELAIRIAELAPSLHFDLYGPDFPPDFRLPTNATLKGAVANFGEVPVEKYKYFMHTAAWDGLPNVLLEACSSGLPIVAPAIGGIPELVNDKTGWLIRDCHNPEAYSQALQSMDRNPREVSKRLKAMRAVVSKRHSTGTFNSKICTIFGD